MSQLQGHSITYRIAVGPHQGRKVFTLQTLPGTEEPFIADALSGRHDRAAFGHVIVEPVDFMAKLAALVPRPRVNLTRSHGVFARGGLPRGGFPPNSKHRALVTPARRGKGKRTNTAQQHTEQTGTNRHVAMTCSQRLKRVFNIDVERCRVCGGKARVIAAAIEDKAFIDKILTHLDNKASGAQTAPLPQVRAPPTPGLFT